MLSFIIIFPIIGSVWIYLVKTTDYKKIICLFIILVNYILSLWIWFEFDSTVIEGSYQFTTDNSWVYANLNFCHLHLGLDSISLYFLLLTCLIIPISVLANWSTIPDNSITSFLICFLVLETFLIGVFTALDLLLFYVFFEAVLIPLFFIVGVWGAGTFSIRIRASILLFLYTLGGSLFILLSILMIYSSVGSTDFEIFSLSEISPKAQKVLWIGIFISIAVKTPIVPFNTWLTYAHSEAPVSGSIVLAGVILKLATYGSIRLLVQFLPDATHYFSPIVQTLAVVSIVYASLSTLRQTDFKKIVAYSSVAHVAIVVLGIFSNTVQGIEGAIILSLGHGVVSPALFFLLGGSLYDRYHTRTIRYYRGLVNLIPIFSLFFFLFTLFNTAIPLSGNWVGEFICLIGAYMRNPSIAIVASLTIVLSAAYSLWIFNRIVFGSWSSYLSLQFAHDLTRREYIVLLPLLFYSLVLGIYPSLVLDDIHNTVSILIYSY